MSWRLLETSFGDLGRIGGDLWASMGSPGGILGSLGGILGTLGSVLGALGGVLGPSSEGLGAGILGAPKSFGKHLESVCLEIWKTFKNSVMYCKNQGFEDEKSLKVC